jgi:hypothetical protein
VIAEPPVDAGAVKAIVAVPLPGVAAPIVGASGTVMGVAGAEAAEAAPWLAAFVALTVNV